MLAVVTAPTIVSPRPAQAGVISKTLAGLVDSISVAFESLQYALQAVSVYSPGNGIAECALGVTPDLITAVRDNDGIVSYKWDTDVRIIEKAVGTSDFSHLMGKWIGASAIFPVELRQRVSVGSVTVGDGAQVHLGPFISMQTEMDSIEFDSDVRFDELDVRPRPRSECLCPGPMNTEIGRIKMPIGGSSL